ncbi:MAG TPA: hypothetical protein VKH36_12625, partial [Acidimicrobiia bacterium]|nr:hypothetical protein [Acidimicrobiia bacterium]
MVSRITSFFDEEPGGPWLLFSPLPTPDLRPLGLGAVGHPPLMLRPPGGARRDPPPELEIVRVADVATLQTFERTAIQAYPLPELADVHIGTFMPLSLLGDDRFLFFLGVVDGRPIGTSVAHLGASMSQVEYVSASPSVHGRAYGEAMTWPATLADANAPSMLIASDLGRPTYERMGYLRWRVSHSGPVPAPKDERVGQTIRTFWASSPFFPGPTSNSTRCPSS